MLPILSEVMRRVAEFADRVEGPVIGQRLNDEGLAEAASSHAGRPRRRHR